MELENVAEIEVEIQESGPAGEQGPPGLSAYEVYLVNGGTLSEKEWLESLKGETGQPGSTPVKGEDYFTEEDIASLKIPTKVSDLENDSGFITEDDITVGTPVITIKSIAGPGTNGSSPTTWFSDTEVCEALSKHVNNSIGNAINPVNIVYGNDLEYYSAFHALSNTVVKSGTNNYYMTSYVENFKDYATIMNTDGIHQRTLSTLFIQGEWTDNVYTCTSYSIYRRIMSFIDSGYVAAKTLTKTNATQYEPTSDYHPSTKKYVDDSVATLGDYVDEQLANIDAPDIDLSEYATVEYVDSKETPIYIFTDSDGLANITEKSIGLGSNLSKDIKAAVQNAYDKGFPKFIIKMYFGKSTVTNYYGRCVEMYFTISGNYISLINTYAMAPYSGGYTRYQIINNLRVENGVVRGDGQDYIFTIKYLGDYKDVSGAIVTEDYVNNAVLGAKKSQIYQLSLTDKVPTSGRDLTTTELSEFKTICNNILSSNDTNAQLKLYIKGDKYIGFMYPQIEYTSAKTIYEVLKSSGLKYLQGKLACSTPPAGTYYAFFDVTLSITGTYDGNTNTISITKVRVQSNVNNHVYNVMTLSNMILSKSNTTSYTPTSNYHPATKKYVDDAITAAITTVLEGEY